MGGMKTQNHEEQECPSVEKLYTENAHQISLTLLKFCVGVVDMHYFDHDLGPQTRPRYGSDLLAC